MLRHGASSAGLMIAAANPARAARATDPPGSGGLRDKSCGEPPLLWPGRPVVKLDLKQGMERVIGIEPTYAAWKAAVLPLNY
ncbi:MAG: hypothetical protein ACOC05_10425, partial [Oceanicaulis sp.]